MTHSAEDSRPTRWWLISFTALHMNCGNTTDSVSHPDATSPMEDAALDAAHCSAETDTVDPETLLAHLARDPIGDVARGPDGTIYYVHSRSDTRSSIGRRVVCGAFDDAWLAIDGPISELEVSTDGLLYLGGTGPGTVANTTKARMFRLDLSVGGASPVKALDLLNDEISQLSAAGMGRVFYLQGKSPKTLKCMTANGPLGTSRTLSLHASLIGLPDGSAFVGWGNGSNAASSNLGHLVYDADGFDSLEKSAKSFYVPPILEAGDANGGFYVSVYGFASVDTYTLVRLPSINMSPAAGTTIAMVDADGASYSALFGLGTARDQALLLTPNAAVKHTQVTLPVPTAQ